MSDDEVALAMMEHKKVWVNGVRWIHPTMLRVDCGLRLAINFGLSGALCRYRMNCTNVACTFLHFKSKDDDELDLCEFPPASAAPASLNSTNRARGSLDRELFGSRFGPR